MPPRLKRLGRPPGSKNKKKIKVEYSDLNLSNDDDPIKVIDVVVEPTTINKKLQCKQCPNKYFKLTDNYLEHIAMEHSTAPGSVACKECHVVCPNESVLEVHVKKTHIRTVYPCEHCGKEFVRQAHVFRHMDQKGCGKKVAQYPCEICKASFTRKDNLIVHLRLSHIQKNRYCCKYCTFSTKNQTKLIRHWHAKHSETPNQFICHHCGKLTSSRAAMTKHLEIHGEKKYACDVCGYSTYTVEVMTRHVLTHVQDKPYKCMCGMSFIQRAQLQRHMDKKHEKQCIYCNKVLDTEELVNHIEKHKDEKKLSCPLVFCSHSKKEYPNIKSLQEHIAKHLSEKLMHVCEVCKKRFPSEMNMRRHLSTHTLDKPRRCMYCVSARAYVRGVQLVKHVRRYHPDVFAGHLAHVRSVLNVDSSNERVTKSEMESILSVLDVESERIMDGYRGVCVLYGGMQVVDVSVDDEHKQKDSESPLMSEESLAAHLARLLEQLVDADTLTCLGWPDEPVDVVLEKVIEQCGAKPADRNMWTRVQRLRENAKHLFLYVVDDKNVAKMLDTHTIDQIIKHILEKVTEDSPGDDQSE